MDTGIEVVARRGERASAAAVTNIDVDEFSLSHKVSRRLTDRPTADGTADATLPCSSERAAIVATRGLRHTNRPFDSPKQLVVCSSTQMMTPSLYVTRSVISSQCNS